MTHKIFTDTATLVIFDIERMKHKLEDDFDWWSIPEDEVTEINKGNALFVNLGSDGGYDLEIVPDRYPTPGDAISAILCSPSGNFYIGAGEEVTGDGFEPNRSSGGLSLSKPAGNYLTSVWWDEEDHSIFIQFQVSDETAVNAFPRSPSIKTI